VRIIWRPKALADYKDWNDDVRKRINELVKSIQTDGPLKGAGMPERLRYKWSGWCSRRIIKEHRLVYRVVGEGDEAVLEIAQCLYHYSRR
jgi:toxin YoeB